MNDKLIELLAAAKGLVEDELLNAAELRLANAIEALEAKMAEDNCCPTCGSNSAFWD